MFQTMVIIMNITVSFLLFFTYLSRTHVFFFVFFSCIADELDDGSDGDSSVRMKIKLKGRKGEGSRGRRKRVTKKYISDDDEEDVNDN